MKRVFYLTVFVVTVETQVTVPGMCKKIDDNGGKVSLEIQNVILLIIIKCCHKSRSFLQESYDAWSRDCSAVAAV